MSGPRLVWLVLTVAIGWFHVQHYNAKWRSQNFQVTNKKLILCNCLVVPSQTSPVSRLKRKRHLNSLAMPLGDRTQMLIEILESLKGYQICLSCGFEYIRAFVSEQLGCQYKSAFCGFYRDLHEKKIYIYICVCSPKSILAQGCIPGS